MMAASRSKRHNAGKNIGKLLDQELDADDFYKTAYGGFEDTLEDGVYHSEESDDDEVDSDFDAPEQEGRVVHEFVYDVSRRRSQLALYAKATLPLVCHGRHVSTFPVFCAIYQCVIVYGSIAA